MNTGNACAGRLTLYGTAASRAARPLWLLEEMGLPYRRVVLDYRRHATRTPAYLAVNPNGRIPTLVEGASAGDGDGDDGGGSGSGSSGGGGGGGGGDVIVWESMAINLYLVRRFGGALAPASPSEEAEVLRWTFWAVTECEKDAVHVLFQRALWPESRRDEASAAQAERRLRVPLRVIDAHLSGRAFLAADRFTVADVNVASVLAWARPSTVLMDEFAALRQWLDRCLARPAYRRVRGFARADEAAGEAGAGEVGQASGANDRQRLQE